MERLEMRDFQARIVGDLTDGDLATSTGTGSTEGGAYFGIMEEVAEDRESDNDPGDIDEDMLDYVAPMTPALTLSSTTLDDSQYPKLLELHHQHLAGELAHPFFGTRFKLDTNEDIDLLFELFDTIAMKYIPLRSFEDVSAALNFEKHGFLMEGSCDLYSVKCVGGDKKLYKKIHEDLNEKHQSNLRVAASLPKAYAEDFASTANLSRASPFGTLTSPGNRRKYAHLIAVLNATHSDHDFSNVLRPEDFVRVRDLDDAVTEIDHKIYDANSNKLPNGLQTPGGSAIWNPKMWNAIDEEMDLRNCEIYQYKPLDDPFAGDGDSAFWDMHYFFLNVTRKTLRRRNDAQGKGVYRYVDNSRCCYLYLRATRQPVYYNWESDDDETVKRPYSVRDSSDYSASKRAKYWFGEQVDDVEDYFFHAPADLDDEGGFNGNGDDDYDLCMLEAMRRTRAGDSAHSPEILD